jgi:hypothetical protein
MASRQSNVPCHVALFFSANRLKAVALAVHGVHLSRLRVEMNDKRRALKREAVHVLLEPNVRVAVRIDSDGLRLDRYDRFSSVVPVVFLEDGV